MLGENGATMLWKDYYYCIGVTGSSPGSQKTTITTSTSKPTTTPPISATSPSVPFATQAGIISTCKAYAKAPSGDGCFQQFASRYGITTTQLYAWNSVLGPNGENCGSSFWSAEYYCTGITAPSAVQAGIPSTCKKWALAPDGYFCSLFASDIGITLAQLYAWNPVLGANGENCGSSFWAAEYYCITVG